MMRCFVSGGNGFIGRVLVNELVSLNIDTIYSTRRKLPASTDSSIVSSVLLNHGIDQLPDGLLNGVDTLFHLANIAHTELASNESYLYERVNVGGTRDLLDAAVKSRVRTFIYVSSVKAAGEPDDLYGQSKQKAEQLVLSYGKVHGLRVVVLRPSLVYGEGVKGNLRSLMHGIVRRQIPWKFVRLPEFNNIRSMLSVQDVVSAMLLSASNKISNGKIYTLSDGEPYTPCQLQHAIYQTAGIKPPLLQIPRCLFSVAADIGQGVQKLTGKSMPFNHAVLDKLTAPAQYDAAVIRKELGWLPQHTFYSQLPAMIAGLSHQPD